MFRKQCLPTGNGDIHFGNYQSPAPERSLGSSVCRQAMETGEPVLVLDADPSLGSSVCRQAMETVRYPNKANKPACLGSSVCRQAMEIYTSGITSLPLQNVV